MKNVTVSGEEFKILAEKNGLSSKFASSEDSRLRYEKQLNDFHDVMKEMMKPEYDRVFPADVVSL
jgi:hypothetical protein